MPTFNIGQDCQAVITTPFGQIKLPELTKFEVDPVMAQPTVKSLEGIRYSRTQFDCYKGSFDLARADDQLDKIVDQYQAAMLANSVVPYGSILYQIFEQNGSVTRYQLESVSFTISKLGSYEADKEVVQMVEFMAQKRTRV